MIPRSRHHTVHWEPDPYAPLEDPPWEYQKRDEIERWVCDLMTAYHAGRIGWADFMADRGGLKECLWRQHHQHDPRHKTLGRPFWSVRAYLEWAQEVAALPADACFRTDGTFSSRTVHAKAPDGKLRAFLRHEHVVPKKALIDWLLEEPESVSEILGKNVCCVVARDEDTALNRTHRATHPDPRRPWKRYEGTGIRLLYNPDWPKDILEEVRAHGLIDEASYNPWGAAERPAQPGQSGDRLSETGSSPSRASKLKTSPREPSTVSTGVDLIDVLPTPLRDAVGRLKQEIETWPEVTERSNDRAVSFKRRGRNFCEFHPKPKGGYVWVHVKKQAVLPDGLHIEERGYLEDKGMRRVRFNRPGDADPIRRACAAAYRTL